MAQTSGQDNTKKSTVKPTYKPKANLSASLGKQGLSQPTLIDQLGKAGSNFPAMPTKRAAVPISYSGNASAQIGKKPVFQGIGQLGQTGNAVNPMPNVGGYNPNPAPMPGMYPVQQQPGSGFDASAQVGDQSNQSAFNAELYRALEAFGMLGAVSDPNFQPARDSMDGRFPANTSWEDIINYLVDNYAWMQPGGGAQGAPGGGGGGGGAGVGGGGQYAPQPVQWGGGGYTSNEGGKGYDNRSQVYWRI